MPTQNLLYKREIEINKSISVVIPTVGEIIDDEDNYYALVSAFTSMPIDLIVQLDDIGIDIDSIDEFELFLILFQGISSQDTKLLLGNLDLSKFNVGVNDTNGDLVLIDSINDIIIDKYVYSQIADTLRKIHHFEKNNKKPANNAAKEFIIKRERIKQKRRAKNKEPSQLESLIIAMVNSEQYKYDFEGTRELSIYQFNECVQQIVHKVDYDNKMHGIYAGTIDIKDININDLNWLVHK